MIQSGGDVEAEDLIDAADRQACQIARGSRCWRRRRQSPLDGGFTLAAVPVAAAAAAGVFGSRRPSKTEKGSEWRPAP